MINYEKGVPINPPSKVFRTITDNINLIEGETPLTYDFNKLSIASKIVNAIQYFTIVGLTKFHFAYISGNKAYLFNDKISMTSAIGLLIDGNNLSESSISFLALDLEKSK